MAHTNPLVNLPFSVASTTAPATPTDVQQSEDAILDAIDALPVAAVAGSTGSHQRRVDDDDPALIYMGLASVGIEPDAAVWSIYRIDMAVGYVWQRATGAWDERATLEYA